MTPQEALARHAMSTTYATLFAQHGIAAHDIPRITAQQWRTLSRALGYAKPPSQATQALIAQQLGARAERGEAA